MLRRLFAVGLAAALAGGIAPISAPAAGIPGTTLSLGMPLAQLDSLPAFRGAEHAVGRDQRRGTVRFFGLSAIADLDFQLGRLAYASFTASEVSGHSRDYMEDQLRQLGYARACARFDRTTHDCVWTGTSRLRVTWTGGALTAQAGTPPSGSEAAPTGSREAALETALGRLRAAHPDAAAATPAAANRVYAAPGDSGGRGVTPAMAPAMAPAVQTSAPPPASAGAASAVFLADTLVLGSRRTTRAQFIAEPLAVPPTPPYPLAASRAGVQGVVRVLATVDSLGRVAQTVVLRSIPELDAEALDAARRYRFVELWSGGHRVGYHIVIPITFTRP